jgi:hypothetical protein
VQTPALTGRACACPARLQVTYGARTYYLTCDALAPGAALSPLLQAALATQTGKEDNSACVDQVVVIKDIVRDGELFLRTGAASAEDDEDDEEDGANEDKVSSEDEKDSPAALRAQIAELQVRLDAAEERASERGSKS